MKKNTNLSAKPSREKTSVKRMDSVFFLTFNYRMFLFLNASNRVIVSSLLVSENLPQNVMMYNKILKALNWR